MSPLLHNELINLHTAEIARNASRHHEAGRPARAKRDRKPLPRGLGFFRVPRTA